MQIKATSAGGLLIPMHVSALAGGALHPRPSLKRWPDVGFLCLGHSALACALVGSPKAKPPVTRSFNCASGPVSHCSLWDLILHGALPAS